MKIFNCLRCKHEWASKQERPIICPKCKSPYWDKVRKSELKEKTGIVKSKIQEYRDRKGSKLVVPGKIEINNNKITPELQNKFNHTGKNEPCPCGAVWPDGTSKKFKYCHGKGGQNSVDNYR